MLGERKKFDKLILMDNVSGLADKSNIFGSFLTVSIKFGYICIYLFLILYLSKFNWQMIISQTKILNIFLGAIQLSSISKILSVNCNHETFNYIPARDLWLNRLYLEISNSREKKCLKIDCRNFNSSDPAKYRTNAKSDVEQFCSEDFVEQF